MLDNGIAYLRLASSAPIDRTGGTPWRACWPQTHVACAGLPRQSWRLSAHGGGHRQRIRPEGPIVIERFKDGNEEIYEASRKGRASTSRW